MRNIALLVVCIIFASCFGKTNAQEKESESTWRFTEQKDSFGENTGKSILFGTFKSENKQLMISFGEFCVLSVRDGTWDQ